LFALLTIVSSPSCPVFVVHFLPVLSCLLCPGCSIQAILSWLSRLSHSVLPVFCLCSGPYWLKNHQKCCLT
jgi:hypothetical protein